MALVIEDGTGKANAESYVSASDCATYAAGHNLTFTGTESEKEAKLRRATQYLDSEYAYKGEQLSASQALAWPRTITAGVPRDIVSACCELACKSGDLWTDVDSAAVIEKTIGPITKKYAAPANGGQKRFAGVDALVKRWTVGGGATIKLVRA